MNSETGNDNLRLQNPQKGEETANAAPPSDSGAELSALNGVVAALQRLKENDARERVLLSAAAFFRILLAGDYSHPPAVGPRGFSNQKVQSSFSEDRTISPKDFLIQKQPQTEVERVACLAYYLTHYLETTSFKTIDISKLNIEAAQPKFVNASQAVENATKTHYLAPAAKGNKQLSAPGELFVRSLPDREAARAAMASIRPRRRRKGTGQIAETGQDGGDN